MKLLDTSKTLGNTKARKTNRDESIRMATLTMHPDDVVCAEWPAHTPLAQVVALRQRPAATQPLTLATLSPPGSPLAIQDQPCRHQGDRIGDDQGAIAGEQPIHAPEGNAAAEECIHAQGDGRGITAAQGFDRLRDEAQGGEAGRGVTEQGDRWGMGAHGAGS